MQNSRMAQATKWLPAILDYMKKVKLNISTCFASFPTRTANYLSLNWNNLTLHTVLPAYGRGHQRYKTIHHSCACPRRPLISSSQLPFGINLVPLFFNYFFFFFFALTLDYCMICSTSPSSYNPE